MSDATVSSTVHLPVGSMLGEYCITGVIGQDGFSIVYLAYEASLDRTVAIKEFFPTVLAQRSLGHSVAVVTLSNQPVFQAGLESFLREAKLQAKFFHPALVEVIRVWEQNNSAYIAMRYHRGQNLRDLKRSGVELSAEQILNFVKPILDALSLLHAHDVIHRDVSPDNILIRETGEPVLLDLGAARTVVAGMTQALTTVLKPGYAPIEQYADDGALEQGPWTDVYGLAAVVYFLYIGKAPPQAVTRVVSDSLVSDELLAPVPSALRTVLRSALAVLPANRYRTIAEFRSAFIDAIGTPTVDVLSPDTNNHRAAVVGDDQDDSTVVLPISERRIAPVGADKAALAASSTSNASATVTGPIFPALRPPVQPDAMTAAAHPQHREIRTLPSTANSQRPASTPLSNRRLKYGAAALAILGTTSVWIWTNRSMPPVNSSAVSIAQTSIPPAKPHESVAAIKSTRNPAAGGATGALTPVTVPDKVETAAPPVAPKAPEIGRSLIAAAPAPAKSSEANKTVKNLQTPPLSSPAHVPDQIVANEPVPKPATAKADPLPGVPSAAVPAAVRPTVRTKSDESLAWERAVKSRSAFDLMAYLGKFPTGEHAHEAHKSLVKAQRSSEGCLLRITFVRAFSWNGKCSGGMAVGEGVLVWETQPAGGTGEGRGKFNNGIMVGRWTFDYAIPATSQFRGVVGRVIDFDLSGNVPKQQRLTYRDGATYVGETNSGMENYFGVRHGEGRYTFANGDEYRGTYVGDKANGTCVKTYKNNLRYKRYTGRIVDNLFDGLGTLEFTDGTALSGNFKRGTDGFDGVVKKLRADGSVAETQMWRDGKPEGSKESPIKGL